MATQKIISGNTQRKDAATIMFGGTLASNSRVTNSLDYTVVNYHSGVSGSIVQGALTAAQIAANTNGDTEPATGRSKAPMWKLVSDGTYAKTATGSYVAKKLTTTLAGVANTALYSGAADFGGRKSQHTIKNIRTAYLKVLTWTGSKDGLPTYSKTVNVRNPQQNDYGNDEGANTTRAIPGELQFMYGAITPQMSDYPARTG